jgi:hypothetical protein
MTEEICVIITVCAFVFFMTMHYITKPSYIYKNNDIKNNNKNNNNKNNDKNDTFVLNLIYSLMFASSIGIFYLFIEIIRQRLSSKKINSNTSVEPPSFKFK